MSLHLEFEPHSWYMNAAIKDDRTDVTNPVLRWYGVLLNGMTGYLVEFNAPTLTELKRLIKNYQSN